jgi:two-component system response regulator DctR
MAPSYPRPCSSPLTTDASSAAGSVVHILHTSDFRQTAAAWSLALGYRAVLHDVQNSFEFQREGDRPTCVLLDFDLNGESSLELQRRLKDSRLAPSVLFASSQPSVENAVAAMKEGAIDVLLLPCAERVFAEALTEALCRDAIRLHFSQRREFLQRRFESLTQREWRVLKLVVEGRLNKIIARDLQMTERTVERVRAGLLEKIGVESAIQVAGLLAEHQLLNNWPSSDPSLAIRPAASSDASHALASVS